VPDLRLAVIEWTGDKLVVEANNIRREPVKATLRTVPAIADRLQAERAIELPPGGQRIVTWEKGGDQ
jgi:hypothetical protein